MNDEVLCEYESQTPGTLLCVKPMGHSGPHDTPSYVVYDRTIDDDDADGFYDILDYDNDDVDFD